MANEPLVYFIRSGNDGPVKIGTTRDLEGRLEYIQAHTPFPLHVLRTVSGAVRVERWLHYTFAEYRLHGEWFSFQPEMLSIGVPTETSLLADECVETADRTYAAIVGAFLRKKYLPLKRAALRLGRDAGTTEKSATNWLSGTNAPNGENLINLMAANPELTDEILRLVQERKRARGD